MYIIIAWVSYFNWLWTAKGFRTGRKGTNGRTTGAQADSYRFNPPPPSSLAFIKDIVRNLWFYCRPCRQSLLKVKEWVHSKGWCDEWKRHPRRVVEGTQYWKTKVRAESERGQFGKVHSLPSVLHIFCNELLNALNVTLECVTDILTWRRNIALYNFIEHSR